MLKYILFDFDGTLVNTNDVIIASWQHTYRTYLGHEAPVEHITACFGEPLLLTISSNSDVMSNMSMYRRADSLVRDVTMPSTYPFSFSAISISFTPGKMVTSWSAWSFW